MTNIFSTVSSERFIGRKREIDQLLRHARGKSKSNGMLAFAAPGVGLTELLTQTYDRLFINQGDIIPFYFRCRPGDKTPEQFAIRFLQSFLQQAVAFRRNDPNIFNMSPDVCEITELAAPSDASWIDSIVETFEVRSKLNDQASFLRQALSAPLRAAALGANSFVIFDDLQDTDHLSGGFNLFEELKEVYARSVNPFVLAGKRRYLFKAAQRGKKVLEDISSLEIGELSFADSGLLAESLSAFHNLNITDQTRDLIARQFAGNPRFIRFLFQTAAERKTSLDTFQRVEEIYAVAILGGNIKGYYDSVFDRVTERVEVRKHLVSLLYNSLHLEKERNPVETWQKHVELDESDFRLAMQRLNTHEITRQTANMVEAMRENEVLSDYINSRFRLEVRGDSRSLVVAESHSEYLKKAPERMASFYRQRTAIGLRELLAVFDCQEIPPSLLDYERFKANHKGKKTEEALRDIRLETPKRALPQIVYTAHTVSLYSPMSKLTDTERSAVALGFEAADYKDESEIVWIAAEIDSKLEANEELTAFWCDRLEIVALMCDFPRYRLWLISPEGFSPEAIGVLKNRKAVGTSRAQIRLLAKYLGAKQFADDKLVSNEYEMVLPMGDDTELIAAYAVEEIARRHSFPQKAINQIKTALVEACINAAEHSHSPDRRIYQRFTIDGDQITITISNRGLRFKGTVTKDAGTEKGRRGWGLKLMKSLMDEVKFERVDDGTRISMTKKVGAPQ